MFKKDYSSAISSYTADMMSGLMIIFLFISISYMIEIGNEKTKAVQEKQHIENIAKQFEVTKYSIYYDLNKEFANNLKQWNAEIDKDTLSVTFNEPDIFFKAGESELNNNFKEILDDFFPRYIKLLSNKKYKDCIEEIRIEGHTSSEWRNKDKGKLTLESYFKNMELSQARTRSVLEYVMLLPSLKKYRMFLIDKVTANGLSYSRRIIKNGKEDYNKSRRVEFRVKTTAENHIEQILNGDKNENS